MHFRVLFLDRHSDLELVKEHEFRQSNHWRVVMKDVMELLRAKEQELSKVKRQVEALRIAAPLLGGDEETGSSSTTPGGIKEVGRSR